MSSLSVEEVFRKGLGGEPYKHQREAAKAILEGNSVVIRAPCGSGKTEACILPFLIGRESNLPSRLIYSLPTRALADDIVERIVDKASKIGSSTKITIQHGANSKDPFFEADLVVATIDQTVGAYCATPLSLPAYLGNIPAGAATSAMLCFDEVHTYDYRLGLQAMLVLVQRAQELHLPCVVMSATLPDAFVDFFTKQEKFGKFTLIEGRDEDVPKRRNREVILRWVGKRLEAEDVLNKDIKGKRVIVVCNTVDRAQELRRQIGDKLSPVFLLHSRFLPEDRQSIEKTMKEHFKNRKPGYLITTQVCEVGLDISCDAMLTEVAPPDALIQRLGRCAREGKKGEAYVFDVENSAPYDENIVEQCKSYIIKNLNEERVGWSEELNLVNSLLNDRFERIMNDKSQQSRILENLAFAAFEGNKTKVEQSVREMLNVNLTIHEDPQALGNDIFRMPWLSIDVRLLRRACKECVQLWLVKWEHDEDGSLFPRFSSTKEVEPYESYVVHPDCASYDGIYGLVFGKIGHSLNPLPSERSRNIVPPQYGRETWIEHALKSLKAFEEILAAERSMVKLLAFLLDVEYNTTCGIIAYAVGLHDLGKLNRDWQKAVGSGKVPLAHVPFFSKTRPPHATISGHALQEAFQEVKRKSIRATIALAIGHHHHTRAEIVNAYDFVSNWREPVEEVCRKIENMYDTTLDVDEICHISGQTSLDAKLPEFEKVKMYTIYAIVSRLVRLSDRHSFTTT